MALTVNQRTRGSGAGVALFSTASVSASAGNLLVLDMFINPATPPITFSPTVVGLGGAWVREDNPGFDQFNTSQRWRCELAAPATSTVDVTWAGTNADILWSLMEVSGQVAGSNGAAAFVQTVRDPSNSITLAAFAVPENECLASWGGSFFPTPAGVPDPTMVLVGTPAILSVGPEFEWVSAVGPEEGDNAYSITWAGSFISRAVASEINVAPATASEAMMFGNNF